MSNNIMLRSLISQQGELEDAFRLDASEDDIKNDKLAKDTYKYLKQRRKLIDGFSKSLSIIDKEHKRGQEFYERCERYLLGL